MTYFDKKYATYYTSIVSKMHNPVTLINYWYHVIVMPICVFWLIQ